MQPPDEPAFFLNVPEDFFVHLGKVIAAWSQVESKFHVFFLHLTDSRAEFEIDDSVLRNLGEAFKRRVRPLRLAVAASRYSADQQARILGLLDRLNTLHDSRDELAHAVFQPRILTTEPLTFATDSVQAVFKSYKNAKDHDWVKLRSTDLQDIYRKMHVLFWDLGSASMELPKGRAPLQRP